MIDQMRESNRIVDISRPKLEIKQGDSDQVYLGFKNDQSGEVDFLIKNPVSEVLSGAVGGAIPACGNEVYLGYKNTITTVSQGETFVLPLNVKVKPNTAEGTCFFDIPVEITPKGGTSSTTKHIELTVDIIP
jgi:hypothetical protein